MPTIDQDVRRAAIEAPYSIILQAPAGSGKTTVLVQRILNLLAGVTEPEEVLAITFTRKAAAEMRERVLTALAEASGQMPVPVGADENHLRSVELARRVLAHSIDRGWDLARHPGRLRIQTIESLNRWIAMQLPATAGLLAGEVAERPAQLYRDAARRTLIMAAETQPLRASLASALRGRENRWPQLEAALADMLPTRARWLPLLLAKEPQQQLAAINSFLEQAATRVFRDARALFGAEFLVSATRVLRATANERVLAGDDDPDWIAWHENTSDLGEDPTQYRCWRMLGNFFLGSTNEIRTVFRASGGLVGIAAEQRKLGAELLATLKSLPGALAMLRQLSELPDPPEGGADSQLLLGLCEILPLAAAGLQQEMAEQSSSDLVAVAGAARAALIAESAPTDLALRLGDSLRHILVDEFQDTSVDQFELLENLTQGWSDGDGRSLLLVGDPMQSIYGFRDANVAMFLRAQSSGIGAVTLAPLALRANFRSAPGIVEFVNEKFSELLPQADDMHGGRVRYVPAIASSGIAVPGQVRYHLLPLAAQQSAADMESARILAIVRELLAQPSAGRIAVLTQARTHVAGLAARLQAAGLPVRGLKMIPLAELPGIQDLQALTRALLDPTDRIAWLAVLRAPWCGASLDALESLAQQAADRSLIEVLQDQTSQDNWSLLAPRLPAVATVLLAALAEMGSRPVAEVVENAWCALGGPACLGCETTLRDAENYLNRLRVANESRGWRGSQSLTDLLDDLYAEPGPDAAIQIMTVHEAKGLQFEHVIFSGLGKQLKAEPSPLLMSAIERDPLSQQPICLLAAQPAASDSQKDRSLFKFLTRRLRARRDDERLRLIYVAATRAIRSLHWVASLKQDANGDWKAPHTLSALHMLWPVLGAEFLGGDRLDSSMAGKGPHDTPVEKSQIAERRPLWRLPDDWSPPQPLRMDPVGQLPDSSDSSLDPTFVWAGSESRHAGTVLHAALHELTESAKRSGVLPTRWPTQAHWAGHLRALGVPAKSVNKAVDRISGALNAMLKDPIGRWVLDPLHRDAACEMAVTGEINGKLVSAVIDRYFVDTEGQRWIIDYKSGRHLGGDLDEFLANEKRRYAPQIDRYRDLLDAADPQLSGGGDIRAALYFPMLQRIVYYE